MSWSKYAEFLAWPGLAYLLGFSAKLATEHV
jgi:hypothetical protein